MRGQLGYGLLTIATVASLLGLATMGYAIATAPQLPAEVAHPELDHLLGGIYAGDLNAKPGFDAVLAVEVERLEKSLLERRLAAQVLTR